MLGLSFIWQQQEMLGLVSPAEGKPKAREIQNNFISACRGFSAKGQQSTRGPCVSGGEGEEDRGDTELPSHCRM